MLFGKSLATTPKRIDNPRADEVDALLGDCAAETRLHLSNTASSSDYLARLILDDPAWLIDQLNTPSDQIFTQICEAVPKAGDPEIGPALRLAKRRVALFTALGDLGGVLDLSQVTQYLTEFADLAVDRALKSALLVQVERGKLPNQSAQDVHQSACSVTVLAMGKMGAFELNYSSDIDVIVLFDETQHDPDDYGELRAGFIRATRHMVALLSDVTEHGYVFRTDLRLRPDPAVTPVCMAMEPAERYYESLGRTWERAAFIKARACAGDIAAGEAFLDRLRPFIWRRHLDFAALQDAHDMVSRIRAHKGLTGPPEFAGYDIKLGPGGIREIEFFAQTQQLIFGGRMPELRLRGTLDTLAALQQADLVTASDVATLHAHYCAHRRLEHRLQMMDDAQTHHIPSGETAIERAAALSGFDDVARFEHEVLNRCAQVHRITSGDDEDTPQNPQSHSFSDAAQGAIERWSFLPALSSPRAQEIFEDLKPEVLAKLATAKNPDEALLQFDAFLTGLPSGVQLFSLFKANGQLLDLLVDICSKAPRLARYLGRNSGVFDAVLGSDFFAPLDAQDALQTDLMVWLERAQDYEDVLDTARKWRKEQSFRTGVHLLRGNSSPSEAAASYSAIAEACVKALLPFVEREVERRYGPAPGLGAAIIAMGKLGSREMTVSSDLDLIVVYDAQGATVTQGRKQLAVSSYFAKFTQVLISALTTQTAQGALYEVDMRLRPSGRKGPVAVSLESFAAYQKSEAWTWERLALTRARLVAGKTALCDEIGAAIEDALRIKRDISQTKADVADMRRRLAEAKDDSDIWEVKSGPGGLLDLELLVQMGLLNAQVLGVQNPRHGVERLRDLGVLTHAEAQTLLDGLSLRQTLQQTLRLVSQDRFVPENADRGVLDMITERCAVANITELEAKLETSAKDCAAIFERALIT